MTTRRFTPHERRARLACALCAGTLLAVSLAAHARHQCDQARVRILEARLQRLQRDDLRERFAVEQLVAQRRENAALRARLDAYERAAASAARRDWWYGAKVAIPRGGGAPSRDADLPSRDQ
ncbi:MAG TPA: hypothetical protein VM490_17000 [Armatimonadaceae bacterium]|nr:hypothetical protein [Armatimonadaceae bacterium]